MRTILGLILIALFAYLGTFLFRIKRIPFFIRSLVSSGLGLFFLGILLGPYAINVLNQNVLFELDVLVNLGVGWVGLLFGLQFNHRDLRRFPSRNYLGAAIESIITLLTLAAGLWVAVQLTPQATPAWLVVIVLAIIGSTSSPSAGFQAIYHLRPHGPVTDSIHLFTSVDALFGIILLGVALCFSNDLHTAGTGILHEGGLWLFISCCLGLILGILFHFFTLFRYSDNQLLVIVLGLVTFCGGAAHYLLLSPLFINFIVGLIVANFSPQRFRVLRSMLKLEKPIYLTLLTLAGAMWNPPLLSLIALVPTFILLRLIGKLLGGALASHSIGLATKNPLGVGPGILSHGGMALVIALNIKLFFPISGSIGDLAITAAISSILVASLLAPWTLHRLLINEGEIP